MENSIKRALLEILLPPPTHLQTKSLGTRLCSRAQASTEFSDGCSFWGERIQCWSGDPLTPFEVSIIFLSVWVLNSFLSQAFFFIFSCLSLTGLRVKTLLGLGGVAGHSRKGPSLLGMPAGLLVWITAFLYLPAYNVMSLVCTSSEESFHLAL